MRVGTESDHRAATLGFNQMAPIEIEPMGIGVELHRDAQSRRLFDHGVNVDRVWLAREQEATGRVCEDGEKRIIEGAEHALSHRRAIHAKARVDGPDYGIETSEQLLVVVETPVGENVRLDALEHAKTAIRQLFVEMIDFLELSQNFFTRETAGVEGSRGVIGDTDVAP